MRAIVPGIVQWVIMAPTGRLVVLIVLVVPVGAAWDRVVAERRNGIRGARKCIVNEVGRNI